MSGIFRLNGEKEKTSVNSLLVDVCEKLLSFAERETGEIYDETTSTLCRRRGRTGLGLLPFEREK